MLGIYDSGLGGMKVLKKLNEIHPNSNVIYFADTKNCPLGEKTVDEITQIIVSAVEFLFAKDCNLVILACNTATAAAIKYVQNTWLPKYYSNKKGFRYYTPYSRTFVLK